MMRTRICYALEEKFASKRNELQSLAEEVDRSRKEMTQGAKMNDEAQGGFDSASILIMDSSKSSPEGPAL